MKVSEVMVLVFTLAKGRLMLNLSSDMESEVKESEDSEDTEVDSEVSGSKLSAMANDRLTLNLSLEDTEAVSEVSVTVSESAKPILKDSSKTKQEKLSRKKCCNNNKNYITTSYKSSRLKGDCWDVRLDFVRQFKTNYVRQLECLVFEEKSLWLGWVRLERERKSNKTLIEHNPKNDYV